MLLLETETVASSEEASTATQPDGLERVASFLGTLLDEKRFWRTANTPARRYAAVSTK